MAQLSLAAPGSPQAILRAVGGGAQRRRGSARAAGGDARRRRAERSGVHSGAHPGSGSGRAAHRPRRRAAGRPQGERLQEIAVAHRQCGARRGAARRHPRHRLRPEGVPPRRVPAPAVFRRPAPVSAGAGAAGRLRHRLCRRGRPAARARRVELWNVGPALDRHSRSGRRVVADPPQEARFRKSRRTRC